MIGIGKRYPPENKQMSAFLKGPFIFQASVFSAHIKNLAHFQLGWGRSRCEFVGSFNRKIAWWLTECTALGISPVRNLWIKWAQNGDINHKYHSPRNGRATYPPWLQASYCCEMTSNMYLSHWITLSSQNTLHCQQKNGRWAKGSP